jgi:hypothetical protein
VLSGGIKSTASACYRELRERYCIVIA